MVECRLRGPRVRLVDGVEATCWFGQRSIGSPDLSYAVFSSVCFTALLVVTDGALPVPVLQRRATAMFRIADGHLHANHASFGRSLGVLLPDPLAPMGD